MTAPKIELKAIKRLEWASQETHCYEAKLYVDGKPWGVVGNDGHGGCDWFHGSNGRNYSDVAALNARIKATMPPLEYEGMTLEQDLELICGELVNAWLRDKDFQRAMRAAVLFTKPDAPGIWQIKVKKPRTHEATLAAVKAKHPAYRFLSDMPEQEARAAYFAA